MNDLKQEKIIVKCLGQSGIRLHFADTVMYVDPYLSNSVEEIEGSLFKRQRSIPIDPASISDANYVFITHIHLDHADPQTLKSISNASSGCKFICPNEVINVLIKIGIRSNQIFTVNDNWLELNDRCHVKVVPSAHPEIEFDETGSLRFVGYIFRFDEIKIYHSGDTSVNEQLISLIKELGPIDVAFLPVNERNYYRDKLGIIGNMSVREAFYFATEIGAKKVVPVHWDMFDINSVYEEEITLIYEKQRPGFDLVMNPEVI